MIPLRADQRAAITCHRRKSELDVAAIVTGNKNKAQVEQRLVNGFEFRIVQCDGGRSGGHSAG